MVAAERPAVSERSVVLLISAIQFINILEFMMVMPLGPDFARDLGIPAAKLGMIGGAYTAAAAVAGLVSSLFIERFDRRKALAFALGGLVTATWIGGVAVSLGTLMAARVLAGIFGGPASSLSLAIIADTIPPERRGKAMGAVMASFSVASVLGVPAGLELARFGGWRMPFFAVAILGIIIGAFALKKLPPLRSHLQISRGPDVKLKDLVMRPLVLLSLTMTALLMMATFLLVPNIAAYIQGNLGYPRDDMSMLYLVGGLVSFCTVNLVGRLVDRYGAVLIGAFGSLVLILVVYFGFVHYAPGTPVMAIFTGFMVASSFRAVPFNALTSQVPRPTERARYMSLQSAVQHFATAAGAFLASELLTEGPGQSLIGVERIGWIAICMTATMPFMMHIVQTQVRVVRAAEK